MRPITVTVGPVTNPGSATSIAAAQTLAQPGQMLLAATPPGGAVVNTFQGNGSFAGDLFTLTSTTSGVLVPGTRLMAAGLPANCVVVAAEPDVPGNWVINPPAPTLGLRQVRGNQVTTLDVPREVLVTNTEAAGNSITVYGTNEDGQPIQETMATNGAALTTSLNFATVTQVVVANTPAGAISVGTTSQAESRWVNFDPWAYGNVSYQVDVQGVANYTVQITNDDPMSPTNPVPPDLVTWFPDPNAGMVGASTPQFAVWQFVPLWARVLLNSGAGAVTATFVQTGVVNR
ncbi:MAG TPA: hypothetical protein VKQ70_06285 [Caulobacteraceae bacterium]|nr:hypothetical protein [Caulobacteraceae bacterium]